MKLFSWLRRQPEPAPKPITDPNAEARQLFVNGINVTFDQLAREKGYVHLKAEQSPRATNFLEISRVRREPGTFPTLHGHVLLWGNGHPEAVGITLIIGVPGSGRAVMARVYEGGPFEIHTHYDFSVHGNITDPSLLAFRILQLVGVHQDLFDLQERPNLEPFKVPPTERLEEEDHESE